MSNGARILIVDDEAHLRKILSIMLTAKGYRTTEAANADQALARVEKNGFDLVITDVRMPGMDGLELLARLKAAHPRVPVIVMTAFSTVANAIAAMKAGAYDYVTKPFKEDHIHLVVAKALEHQGVLAENENLRAQVAGRFDLDNFIGRSAAMKKVFETIRKVAPTRSTVLISGPSGTGKELAARSIHHLSPRSAQPFVAINCAAVPANLLESEFFGFAKGAFSGAEKAKKGLFEEAEKGTLFLDEISELPLELQGKILRAIQEGEVLRLGDASPRRLDFRLIAASNKDLTAEIRAGRFRADLFYRLAVIDLRLPPLAQRSDDIALLAQHFLAKALKKNNLPPLRLTASALKALTERNWPGNVRELENVIEQAAVMAEGGEIGAGELPFAPGSSSLGGLFVRVPEGLLDLKKAQKAALELTERAILEKALAQTGGNRTQAARLVGLSRRALITKIQALGLD